MSIELHVDRARCDGHRLCHTLLAEYVALDEWGFPILASASLPDTAGRDVRRAVAACPALALRSVRRDGSAPVS